MNEYLFFLFAGASGGFLSGLLGIGGGIVMVPILLYLPPLLNLPVIEMKSVAGLTITQGFFSSLSALFIHHKNNFVNKKLVAVMGFTFFIASLAGGFCSDKVSNRFLLALFAVLTVFALLLIFQPLNENDKDNSCNSSDIRFNIPKAVMLSVFLGFLLGMVGQGGAFIIIPAVVCFLKIPFKVAIGSMLGINLFSTVGGFLGKLGSGQILLTYAALLVAGAIPAAQLGACLSKKADANVLKTILSVIIGFTAIKVCITLLK